jgi:hypothetical protein
MTYRPASKEHVDGRLFPVKDEDVRKGACLRMVNPDGSAPPFSDFLVVSRWPVDKHGTRLHPAELDTIPIKTTRVTIARPYAFVSGAETSCPTVLTGVETMVVDMESLTRPDSHFRVLVTARGAVHTHTT